MSSSLFNALGDFDDQLNRVKIAIVQEKLEIEHHRKTLAQMKLQNQTLAQSISKFDLEIQIVESETLKAKVTKKILQDELRELKTSAEELLERKVHVGKQLDRVKNHLIEKRKKYQELRERFKERYDTIPGIEDYESILVANNLKRKSKV